MTRWVIESTPEDWRVARLAALAIGLAVLESGIPSPLPGVKPGLANIVVLLVMVQDGWRLALWVSLLRIIGASLFLGSFMTPGFFLSLSGGLCSLLMQVLVSRLSPRWFGLVSWSVLASLAHMAGQLLVVFIGFIPSAGVLQLVPLLAGAALFFGIFNGWIANRLLLAWEKSARV